MICFRIFLNFLHARMHAHAHTQEMALNIFVSDAYLFFPAFSFHMAIAVFRPALFLFVRPPAACQAPAPDVSATLTLAGRPIPSGQGVSGGLRERSSRSWIDMA
jgi:hypothetical protein